VWKAKAAKGNFKGWHGRAAGGTGRAMSLTLGVTFLSYISYFHPESASNPLSFAPRLNLQIFVPEI